MTNSPTAPHDSTPDRPSSAAGEAAGARRALLVSESEAAKELDDRLAAAGLAVSRSTPREAFGAAREGDPAVVLLAFAAREGESALVTLARRLRADPSTLAVPIVFLFREDSRALRSAAQHFGADDYLAQDAPADEIRARLASLFWRVEASRRAAPALAEQRDEIDNFIFLLDAVAADQAEGLNGTVALVEASSDTAGSGRVLREAYGFLKLNLRRADAVALYGPTTLAVYLPRADSAAARATLARLRQEFRFARAGADLLVGLASFPADGAEVETLVERAEAALGSARGASESGRVRVYGEETARRPARSGFTPEDETRRGVAGPAAALDDGAGAPASGRGSGAPAAASELEAAAEPERTGDARRVPEVAAGRHPGRGRVGTDGAEVAPPSAREAAEPPSPEEFRPRRSTLRRLMLVISDAARMAQVNLLMRSASYEVRAAFDGNHALNLLRIDTPDVLLLDYELHGMNGAEMLRRLGQQSGGRLPPTVVLTPAGREDLRREAAEAGAWAVVELPYDPVELLETLSAADRGEE